MAIPKRGAEYHGLDDPAVCQFRSPRMKANQVTAFDVNASIRIFSSYRNDGSAKKNGILKSTRMAAI
jgi:hypothetical protein